LILGQPRHPRFTLQGAPGGNSTFGGAPGSNGATTGNGAATANGATASNGATAGNDASAGNDTSAGNGALRADQYFDADAFLHQLTWAGAQRRYGNISRALRRRIEEELAVIGHLAMADYFLVAWDVVQFAKKRGIRSNGRGSAADSVVAYCLGLTNVDAFRRGLSFERFLSVERGEPPDIDIDFEAHRRDEVAAYVYERYGKDR